MSLESLFFSGVSLLLGLIMFYFGFRSFLIDRIKLEDFIVHLNFSWFILGLLWVVIGIIEFFIKINTLTPVLIIKVLVFFAIPFLLEISLFYNSIFSNRLIFVETYVPILIGLSFGLNLGSLFVSNYLLDNFVLLVLSFTGIIIFIEFLVMYRRFRKVLFSKKEHDQTTYFFRKIINVSLLLLVASSADIIIFLAILIDVELISLASTLVFLFFLGISILVILENRNILINFKKLDVSLILNEIN